jgi:hypothetical protein
MNEEDVAMREIEYEVRENIAAIQSVIISDTHFYIISNKKNRVLGYYLFSIDISNPHGPARYLINWPNKLDIGNVGLDFMKEKLADGSVCDSIVVSYKMIGINTYNVFVIDTKDGIIKYRHEGF